VYPAEVNQKEIESPQQTARFLFWVVFFALIAIAGLIDYRR
jgi:hypothetical protein